MEVYETPMVIKARPMKRGFLPLMIRSLRVLVVFLSKILTGNDDAASAMFGKVKE